VGEREERGNRAALVEGPGRRRPPDGNAAREADQAEEAMTALANLRRAPETIVADDMRRYLAGGSAGIHESLFKSRQVLNKARRWLELGAPSEVVLEMIEDSYAPEPKP
jgi:hypothetical protein